jgi:hypothetical protein
MENGLFRLAALEIHQQNLENIGSREDTDASRETRKFPS